MKTTATMWAALILMASSPSAAGEMPDAIAVFRLGGRIADVAPHVRMGTLQPLRFSPFIDEVGTSDIPGYKYGLLWVGNCENPGRIVRIKMKYADPSREFYGELLERVKKRFGKPREWRGDPFHVHIAWKWGFVDEKGNDVSMVLEHNTRDEDQSIGNTIKLTLWNLVEAEQRCHQRQHPAAAKKAPPTAPAPPDWSLLVPR